jgi:hypothetical protein
VNEENAPVPASNKFELILLRWSIMISFYGFFFINRVVGYAGCPDNLYRVNQQE